MNPDLAARRLIVAAYLYYERASPLVSDAAYDTLTQFVADNFEWITPIRKFQLGLPEELLVSGSHIKVTRAGESCACWKFKDKFSHAPHGAMIHTERYRIIHPWGSCFATFRG